MYSIRIIHAFALHHPFSLCFRYYCSIESKDTRKLYFAQVCSKYNSRMPKFATFVFFDIETTGLPYQEFNRTKITEFACVACSRNDVMNHTTVPRVIHKLTKCVHPGKSIDREASAISGKT